MNDLVLYYMPSCPFCQKVLQYMESEGIELAMKNTLESSDIKSELISIGGKSQVPCLVINGEAMYESEDIINWLKENKPS